MCNTLKEGGEEGLFSGLDSSQKNGSKLGGADTGWLDSWTLVVSKWSPTFWTWKWEISAWVSCKEEIKHNYMQPSPLYSFKYYNCNIHCFVSSKCNPQMPTGHFISAIWMYIWDRYSVMLIHRSITVDNFCQDKHVIPLYFWTMPMILNDWKSPRLNYTEVAYVFKSGVNQTHLVQIHAMLTLCWFQIRIVPKIPLIN